jgi:hypothetical protein
MDNINFDDFESEIKNNFYSDDFAYLIDLESPDVNGNSAGFTKLSSSDMFFDNPSDFASDDFF